MSEDLSGFLETVTREAEAVAQFIRLLEQEKAFLTAGRTESLVSAAEEKERLAAKLNELTQQRVRYLRDRGFAPDRQGMASWLDEHPGQKETMAAWNRTLSLSGQAKELNRLNGQLIHLHMQYTGQALEVLSRKESRLDLYGPDGRSTTSEIPKIDDAI
jgi:flagella synthesis protein FlgN